MTHRVFIAINLPESVKESLFDYQNKHQDIPAKWTAKENLHITVVFIGDVEEKNILEIKQVLKNLVVRHKTFLVSLNNIDYDLFAKNPTPLSGVVGTLRSPATLSVAKGTLSVPRMIWAIADKSEEFISLCATLSVAVGPLSGPTPVKRGQDEVIPHVTLARIKEWEWRRIEPDERLEVGESIDLSFEVKSIELMESILKRTGPEYKILESYKLIK